MRFLPPLFNLFSIFGMLFVSYWELVLIFYHLIIHREMVKLREQIKSWNSFSAVISQNHDIWVKLLPWAEFDHSNLRHVTLDFGSSLFVYQSARSCC